MRRPILRACVLSLLFAPMALADPTSPRSSSPSIAGFEGFLASPGGHCTPSYSSQVENAPSFRLQLGSPTPHIEVVFRVDGKVWGTERIEIDPSAGSGSPAIDLLRSQPNDRSRLLHLHDNGRIVTVTSVVADGQPSEWSLDTLLATGDFIEANAPILRSTWRKGGEGAQARSGGGLRRIVGSQTYQQCAGDCHMEELDCINEYCYYPDPQCLYMCEQQYNWCLLDCPCTGEDPILVNQYATQERIIVSGPHGITCRWNALGPGNVLYDVYTVFTRTRTYRVWEDCHGVQTTELVSTHDSGNHACYAISQQACSPAVGPAPCVLF